MLMIENGLSAGALRFLHSVEAAMPLAMVALLPAGAWWASVATTESAEVVGATVVLGTSAFVTSANAEAASALVAHMSTEPSAKEMKLVVFSGPSLDISGMSTPTLALSGTGHTAMTKFRLSKAAFEGLPCRSPASGSRVEATSASSTADVARLVMRFFEHPKVKLDPVPKAREVAEAEAAKRAAQLGADGTGVAYWAAGASTAEALVSWVGPYDAGLVTDADGATRPARCARINMMFVSEVLRGQGVAKPLLYVACERIFRDLGVDAVHLFGNHDNEVAMGLYSSFGFTPLAHRSLAVPVVRSPPPPNKFE